MKREPQWPGWGWNQISCPCSWQQGLWDLRFQPIHIGDISFLSLGVYPLSPTSPPTIPLVTSNLSLSRYPLNPSPGTPHPDPVPTTRVLGLSMSGLVAGWWGLRSRQLCSFSSWRGGVCCSYGSWGELLEGWRVQSPWLFGMCVHRDLNPTFSGALCSSLSSTSSGLNAKQWDPQNEAFCPHFLPVSSLPWCSIS